MSTTEIVGLITGILTIIGAIVALTRYVTHLQSQVRIERLEAETEQAEKARSDLAATNRLLLDELAAARRTGAAASAKRGEIDDELCSLMKLASAEGGSVYLPIQDAASEKLTGLAFLTIQPVTEEMARLRKRIIPPQSLAGRCFTSGQAFVVVNAEAAGDHYKKADELSGYRTRDLMNVPLQSNGRSVGVLQLLTKQGGEKFSEADLDKVRQLSARLATRVDEFSLTPGGLDLLGIVPDSETQYATVMFCDLTASSRLFQELNVSAAVLHINEYLEGLCNVAFRYGATVDKYMGDGVLFRFNVPHPLNDHPTLAIQCAVEMQSAFNQLKRDWVTMDSILEGLYTRAGLAYGSVKKATVGHPQYQYLTIFGPPVNAAVNLCEIAARDRNTIVIDEGLYGQISRSIRVNPVPASLLGKASNYTSAAYELIGVA